MDVIALHYERARPIVDRGAPVRAVRARARRRGAVARELVVKRPRAPCRRVPRVRPRRVDDPVPARARVSLARVARDGRA